MFDKRNQFQSWNDVCYFGNPYVRNKSKRGGHVFVEYNRVLDPYICLCFYIGPRAQMMIMIRIVCVRS